MNKSALHRRVVCGIMFVVAACTGDASPRRADADSITVSKSDAVAAPAADTVATLPVQLVDTAIAPAVAGEGGWNYHRTAEADLNGDGRPERVVLTAMVELYRGRPAWDDGQYWQVYIQEQDGRRTYVYARRLQLGTLAMRITSGSNSVPPAIVLLEHLPDQLSVYEASYEAPGRASTIVQFQRDLDPRGETASPQMPE